MAGARGPLGAAARSTLPDQLRRTAGRPSVSADSCTLALAGRCRIAACVDALLGQVYGAIYVVHPGRVETLVPPAVLTVPELARIAPVRPQLVVGDGAMLYADVVRAWSGADPVPRAALPPAASAMLSLFTREGATRVIAVRVPAG